MAVTNLRLGWIGVLLIVIIGRSSAGVLPEERTDILQHRYAGDGISITGPSVLVRKNMNNKIAFSGHYYVDRISGATVDVRTYGSPYAEERTETSVGADIIHNKTSWHANVLQSNENDYQAKNVALEINQSFFGDLSTLTLGIAQGWDTVMDRISKQQYGEVDRHSYRLGWSQVLTPTLIANVGVEVISDEGYLKNQYRQVRYLDANNLYAFEPENYPNTRTSYAAAIGAMQYLNANHVLGYRYRYFTDSWDIQAHTVELEYRYQHNQWLWVSQFRAYQQGAAEFYADIFPYANYQEFKARDKELSEFQSYGISVGATYVLPKLPWQFVEKSTLNVFVDHLSVDYDNFYDATNTDANGQRIAADQQPLFHLSANAIRVFFSVWY